ncbi:hypothetical protein [Mangrovimonas xylaniphaga]|uniref:hypothetical protein n=1 Tax=Mangrovimonas xylaniphaga TaxID=1645915 RepID=UPI0012F9322F|nr:hypothetical protein [Mangrovimonas xylaniphaga]
MESIMSILKRRRCFILKYGYGILKLMCIGVGLLLCTTCSSSDEDIIEKSLLEGYWYYGNLCPEQNSLWFGETNYVHKYSGNNCEFNESDTFQFSGAYIIRGKYIEFNEELVEVIIEGISATQTLNSGEELVYSKIVQLDSDNLKIEQLYRHSTYDRIYVGSFVRNN